MAILNFQLKSACRIAMKDVELQLFKVQVYTEFLILLERTSSKIVDKVMLKVYEMSLPKPPGNYCKT